MIYKLIYYIFSQLSPDQGLSALLMSQLIIIHNHLFIKQRGHQDNMTIVQCLLWFH